MRGERGETDWFIYLFICGDPKMGYNTLYLFCHCMPISICSTNPLIDFF